MCLKVGDRPNRVFACHDDQIRRTYGDQDWPSLDARGMCGREKGFVTK